MRYKTKTIQTTSECSYSGNKKWKLHFVQPLTSTQASFRWHFRYTKTAWKPPVSWKWAIFHFDLHGNVSTWAIDQTALHIQFHSHIGIHIHCGIEKSVESTRVLSIESRCWQFYPEKPLILLWPKSNVILTQVSFTIVLKFCSFGGNGLRFELSATCSVRFSGSWSFWDFNSFEELVIFCFRFLLFRIKSTQKLSLYYLGGGGGLQDEPLSLIWSVRVIARTELQRLDCFSNK